MSDNYGFSRPPSSHRSGNHSNYPVPNQQGHHHQHQQHPYHQESYSHSSHLNRGGPRGGGSGYYPPPGRGRGASGRGWNNGPYNNYNNRGASFNAPMRGNGQQDQALAAASFYSQPHRQPDHWSAGRHPSNEAGSKHEEPSYRDQLRQQSVPADEGHQRQRRISGADGRRHPRDYHRPASAEEHHRRYPEHHESPRHLPPPPSSHLAGSHTSGSLLKSNQISDPPPMPPLVEISSTRSASAKRQSKEMSEAAVRPDPKPIETARHNDDDVDDDDSDSDALVIDIADDPQGSPKKAAPAAPPPESPNVKEKAAVNTRKRRSSLSEKSNADSTEDPKSESKSSNSKNFKIPKRKSDEKVAESSSTTTTTTTAAAGPSTSKGISANGGKFEQVEDALEAMFAGVASGESDSGTGSGPAKKGASGKASKAKSAAGATAKESAASKQGNKSVKAASAGNKKKATVAGGGGRKSKPESRAFTPPPMMSLPNGSHRLLTGKAKRKPATTAQEILLERYRGPFIRVEGDPNSPRWSHVINTASDPINESEERTMEKPDLEQKVRASGFGNLATNTLSTKYDAKRQDETWLCVFCKKASHFQGLGDLFGPYTASKEVMNAVLRRSPSKNSHSKPDLASKFIIGGGADTKNKSKHRRKLEGSASSEATAHLSPLQQLQQQQASSSSSSDGVEIWFHEDCLCWLPCIKVVGHMVLGLDEAIRQTHQEVCSKCQQAGCTLGCVHAGCRETSHYLCARLSGWIIDEDSFQAMCGQHTRYAAA